MRASRVVEKEPIHPGREWATTVRGHGGGGGREQCCARPARPPRAGPDLTLKPSGHRLRKESKLLIAKSGPKVSV